MHAIILADRPSGELHPLVSTCSIAMLPIGNKPLISITLEELHGVGIRSATILANMNQTNVKKYIGYGSRWGMKVDYAENENPIQLLERFSTNCPQLLKDCVVVRGDILRPFGLLEEALLRRESQDTADIYTALGISLISAKQPDFSAISWEVVQKTCRLHPCLVESLAAYHDANMMSLNGLVPGVRMAGRPTPDQMVVGYGSVIRSTRAPSKRVVIGNNCLVEAGVELGANTVIGNDSIIDKGTSIVNSVVLPGSYIGRGVVVADAIVKGNLIYSVKSGVTVQINDSRILASIEQETWRQAV